MGKPEATLGKNRKKFIAEGVDDDKQGGYTMISRGDAWCNRTANS